MPVGLYQLLLTEDLGQNISVYPLEINIITVKWLCMHNSHTQLKKLMCLMNSCALVCDGKILGGMCVMCLLDEFSILDFWLYNEHSTLWY